MIHTTSPFFSERGQGTRRAVPGVEVLATDHFYTHTEKWSGGVERISVFPFSFYSISTSSLPLDWLYTHGIQDLPLPAGAGPRGPTVPSGPPCSFLLSWDFFTLLELFEL